MSQFGMNYSARGIFFILVLTIVSNAGAQQTSHPDSTIARVWLERAAELLQITPVNPEILDEAAQSVRAAREYRSPGSDSLYLEARLVLEGYPFDDEEIDSPVRKAYSLLSESLESLPDTQGRDIIPFEERAILFASQALRLKEYRALLDSYATWPRGEQDPPVLLYAAARAALYLGLENRAAELAMLGENLSGSSTNLGLLGLELGNAPLEFRVLAAAAGTGEGRSTLEAAMGRWGVAFERGLLPWVLSGHIDPAYLLALPVTDVHLRSAIDVLSSEGMAEYPLTHELFNDLALLRRWRNELGDLDAVHGDLGSFTGNLVSDADYDGFPEEIIGLVNGRPDFRWIDSDQDGSYEWEFIYSGGEVLQAQLGKENMRVNFHQGAYPEVSSLNLWEDQMKVDISFRPGAFQWHIFSNNALLDPPNPPTWPNEEFWTAAREVTVTEKFGDEVGQVVTSLSKGYPVRAVEFRYLEDNRALPLWVREIIFDEGVAVAGRRSYRFHPEHPTRRLWELYERFEDGVMVGLAWDPGMVGTPLYLRDWALNRYLETQAWDIDADGWVDVRRFVLPEGRSDVRELFVAEARYEDILPWTGSEWTPWER